MTKPVSRRQFFKIGAGGLLGLYAGSRLGVFTPIAEAAIPGGTLDPAGCAQVRDAAAHPAGDAEGRDDHAQGGKPIDYYEISVRQFTQQILPAGTARRRRCGATAPSRPPSRRGLLLHNAPSLTIEAQSEHGRCGSSGSTSWWMPTATTCRTCCRSTRRCTGPTRPAARRAATRARRSTATPGPYTGPVPIVTHVHGAVGVGDESDGYAEAWYLPAASNIPAGYATEGTWYDFFAGKAAAELRRDLGTRATPPSSTRTTQPRLDHLVPRPHPGHDPAERLRRPGRLLHHPRRPAGDSGARLAHRHAGRAARARRPARATSSRPTRPTTRSPSPSRTAPSTPTARCSTRTRARSSTAITRARIIPDDRHLADLEPRVLRQHDHGQRQHLAVPGRRAAPLPLPLPQRLPVALPDPGLQPASPASRSGRSATRAASWPRR